MTVDGQASSVQHNAYLWITRDFAEEIILDKKVEYQDESVMEILRKSADVQTSYAGAFVVGINGITSSGEQGKKSDWLYYVNGILAQIGASQYIPQHGDNIWWDYHRWENGVLMASVIGAFPQPFVNGFGGKRFKTHIVSSPQLMPSIEMLTKTLKENGVKEIEISTYQGQVPENENQCVILVGAWADIKDDSKIKELAKNYLKTGFFVQFNKNQIQALDITGTVVKTFQEAAVILSVSSAFQQQLPLWIITGTDDVQAKKALETLALESEKIKFHSGAIVTDNQIINIPIFHE